MIGERILVVDDEPQIQRFLKPALKAAGYDVVEAATGGEALKAVATTAPDLVILDLGLPDMDGKDVLTSLRGWTTIPVIILSARSSPPARARARRSQPSISAPTIISKSLSISKRPGP